MIAIFIVPVNSYAEEITPKHYCPEHGEIEDVVTFVYKGMDFDLCGECVDELVMNNSETVKKLLEFAQDK